MDKQYIVTVNAGSSSIKMAIFVAQTLQKTFEATVANIGQPLAGLVINNGSSRAVMAENHSVAAALLIEQLSAHDIEPTVIAVGHRIVHGGSHYYKSELVTDDIVKELHTLEAFDPEHLPIELTLVDVFQKTLPKAQHILCFDTAFHHELPTRSRLLPIPRHFEAKGIRRYGFHGLSYAYVVEELRRVEGEDAANGKVIIAHLGSGASLAALYQGKPVDTTMSMTPASGIPMSSRSGDLDPGIMLYLAKTEGFRVEQINHMANYESGLLGISETTSDMKELLEIETSDVRAKNAIDIFCYNITKTIGAYAAALGGLDSLVFTGGMGENAPKIRARVCAGLEFLGITLNDERNQAGERLISSDGARVGVHVIHTDEAVTIARETNNIIQGSGL